MPSTFFGLEMSNRALQTQQLALNVTGHNISNANTKGYTRQVANMRVTHAETLYSLGRAMSLGTGVTMGTITRSRDFFIDKQLRTETSKQQYWESRQSNLSKVEEVINEPTENSLSDDMTNFWNAWSDLSKNPDNSGARSIVRARAATLTDSFHNLATQLKDRRDLVDASIQSKIKQINVYSQQIRDLNEQIKNAEIARDNPNDLRDQRDLLVDELSKIVNVRVIETKDNNFSTADVTSFKVVIGNEADPLNVLVDDFTANFLLDPPSVNADGYTNVSWPDLVLPEGVPVNLGVKVGSLQSDLDVRDIDIPALSDKFDTLAQGIANMINALHRQGQGLVLEPQITTGIDFFTDGTETIPYTTPAGLPTVTAENISINLEILDDVKRIATGVLDATDVTIGDNAIAQAISSLATGWTSARVKDLIDADTFGAGAQKPVTGLSFADYYQSTVADFGVDVQQAMRMKAGQDALVDNLTYHRESVSGVSTDEEMANLIKFQKSYSAAARMVTMMDSMLDTLLGMGLTR